MYEKIKRLIDKIILECSSEPYIYRGTTRKFDGDYQVISGIYRKFDEAFRPIKIEEDIVRRARRHFAPADSNIKVLTDLRHFGAPTTLIDFSGSLMVALFFACNGNFDRSGQLITLRTTGIAKRLDIDYSGQTHDLSIIEPTGSDRSYNRLQMQSSVFVHAPDGFIPNEHWKAFSIPKQQKIECLTYLRKFHNIEEKTIFNDFTGFLENLERNVPAEAKFYSGLELSFARQHKKAIEYYNEAIKLNPLNADAYMNRGNDKERLKDYDGAMRDYDEANLIRPNDTNLYLNRGNLKYESNDINDAIRDYDTAIKLKTDNSSAYNSRGIAKEKLGDSTGAISDYERAIDLQQNHSDYYFNRAGAREKIGDIEGAISDYDRAIDLESNYAIFYYLRGCAKEKIGDIEGAISDYDLAIELEPYNANFYNKRGRAKEKIGDIQGAKADFALSRRNNRKPRD